MPNLATDLARVIGPKVSADMNSALCAFAMRWELDGDYIRCRKCTSPQLTTYSDREFLHHPGCKAAGTVETHPWRTYLELLAPLIAAWNTRAASGGDVAIKSDRPFTPNLEEPASLEQRARELFDSMMDAAYGGSTIGHIVCAETTRGRLEAAWLPLITAAMRAQPPSGAVSWSEKEQTAIREMMAAQELSYPALVRQAVHLYQYDWIRRRDGETCTWSGDKQREREFSGAALANQQGVGNGWRCFYCDETFTDREAAALHFGEGAWPREDTPACQIDIAEYRRMEAVQRRYQDEDADHHRALHRQANEHHLALQRAEEAGYARGLKDSGQCPCSASTQPAGDVGRVEQ